MVPGRFNGLQVTQGTTSIYAAGYEYGDFGRINHLTGPGLPVYGATYEYMTDAGNPAADLVTSIEYRSAAPPNGALARTTWHYEPNRDILNYVNHIWRPDVPVEQTISWYAYHDPGLPGDPNDLPGADALGRRTHATYSGVAHGTPVNHSFSYNDRNELTGFTRGPSNWNYDYDHIGNRTSHTVDVGAIPTTSYTTNELNQYRRLQSTDPTLAPGFEYDADGNLVKEFDFVKADMNCDGVVNFSDIDPFLLALQGQAAYEAQYPYCNWLNGDIDGDLDVDDADNALFVDQMGANGVRWEYTWDAENRLTRVAPGAGTEEIGEKKVEFTYDHMGRRVRKVVSTWNGSAWVEQSCRKFVWSGWLMLLELDGQSSDAVIRQYTWGLDLAGLNGQINSLEEAGGIGGLLAVHQAETGSGSVGGGVDAGDYIYCYDANGNVVQVADLAAADASSAIMAKYEYDAYGRQIGLSMLAYRQPFRFSTKYHDSETGLGYWGYRYYSPAFGRWISRDPIEESGGLNLYAYVDNQPPTNHDALGLWKMGPPGRSRRVVESEIGDTVRDLGLMMKLTPEEYEAWLAPHPHALPGSAERRIGPGCRYTVPNEVFVVWGALKSSEDWWYPLSIWNQFASNMTRNMRAARAAGYKVISSDQPTAVLVEKKLRDPDLYGFMYAGHTNSAGALIVQKPHPPMRAVPEGNYRERNNGFHKLAFVFLWGCGTGESSYDAIRLEITGRTDVWATNVSRIGTFRTALDSPNLWTYTGDWTTGGMPGQREE